MSSPQNTAGAGGGSKEPVIDLAAQIDQEIKTTTLIIEALKKQPASPNLTDLLVHASATRDHLALLQAHLVASTVAVTISPEDDDYLTLKAIGDRLDKSIKNSALVSTAIDDLNLLLSTINKGFQIAHQLTAV